MFGYEGFILGERNPYTAKSVKGTMLSYLEKDKLIQILQNFPHDKVNICLLEFIKLNTTI